MCKIEKLFIYKKNVLFKGNYSLLTTWIIRFIEVSDAQQFTFVRHTCGNELDH